MKYQLVIPMSGFGERFKKAGYTIPKPLIKVNGKPIIAHVLDMFPKDLDVFFICNQEHLDNADYKMHDILKSYAPNSRICGIAPHKLGPVYAVSQIFDLLDLNLPTIVNYCDFTATWSWNNFESFIDETQCDGAVLCYTGFHPHMLGCFNYAYVKLDEQGNIQAIQEKQPYTDTPMQEYASSGTYFYKTGAILKHAFEATLQREDLMLNGEYYASLAYRPLLEDGCNIKVFPVEKFCQWGTPEDLAEWNYHYKSAVLAKQNQARPNLTGVCLIPMAGMGSRFVDAGYEVAKPLINVQGQEMVIKAWQDLPVADSSIFVLRTDMLGHKQISKKLTSLPSQVSIVNIDACTEGQAITCLLGLKDIEENTPLTIAACDNGLRYNANKVLEIWNSDTDIIVWTMRGHINAIKNPQMYGWVDADRHGLVRQISVKIPLCDPINDPIVTGTFSFKRVVDFKQATQRMLERNGRINGEFYVDECINDAIAMGLKVRLFDVDAYLCWGTPDELKTFNYYNI